jgi:DNA-binding CsgD family transcriptional regulator
MRIALQQKPAQTAPPPAILDAAADNGRKNKPKGQARPKLPATPAPAPLVAASAPPVTLSGRELQIMRHLAEGQTAQQVADALFISKRTVDFHVGNVYDKCSVSNRTQCLLFLMQQGVLCMDSLKVCSKANKKQTGAKNKQEAGKSTTTPTSDVACN